MMNEDDPAEDDPAEDAADVAAYDEIKRRLAAGEEELIPAEYANRILDGENKVRVWREYRGMTVEAIADAADVAPTRIWQIETDAGRATPAELAKIAVALQLDIDDIV